MSKLAEYDVDEKQFAYAKPVVCPTSIVTGVINESLPWILLIYVVVGIDYGSLESLKGPSFWSLSSNISPIIHRRHPLRHLSLALCQDDDEMVAG